MPKVSICIPAFNQTHYLKKNLASIIAQSFNDYEIIITDDSTNKEVKELIDTFDFNGKLKYYHNSSPLGSPKNWNYSISKASGQYIKILHHDDWFSSDNSLQKLVELLESSPDIAFVFCGSNSLTLNGENIYHHHINSGQFINLKLCPESLFKANAIGAPSVTLYKKNNYLFDENIKYLVDIDFYISNIKSGINLAYTSEVLVNIGLSSSQVTNLVVNNIQQLIYEYSYTFQKLKHTKEAYKYYFDAFWELITLFNITSVNQLVELGWVGNIPLFICNYFYVTKLPTLLKRPKLIKLVKAAIYLYSINFNYYKAKQQLVRLT